MYECCLHYEAEQPTLRVNVQVLLLIVLRPFVYTMNTETKTEDGLSHYTVVFTSLLRLYPPRRSEKSGHVWKDMIEL